MSNFNRQIVDAWDEWQAETGENAGNPDDFIPWAIKNGKLTPRPQDINKLMRRSVTAALRQSIRVDDNGIAYRAKQCVVLMEAGAQTSFYFDTDTGGTPNLRRKASRQRRDAIVNDIYKAKSDVVHMNTQFPEDEEIQFLLDFTDDYYERKAAEELDREDKDAA